VFIPEAIALRFAEVHIFPAFVVAMDGSLKLEKENASALPPDKPSAGRSELQKERSRVVAFLQVLILGIFKSLKMEVLILRELRARFIRMLVLRGFAGRACDDHKGTRKFCCDSVLFL
jgi:hypothetical protein